MKFNSGKQFEQAPPGSQIARCYALTDLGTQPHKFGDKPTTYQRDVRILIRVAAQEDEREI